ncbi:TfoX/Sxy family protein [Paraglaciecola aquimarina]|uniref:TfoX/Sxy family protein n=1 Tax=Paraglaciecola algarum TaxID=3050085 RepID=A0ABS9DDH2_9ALTE|nr:TfoX/Sxy family protein [Paraglaciecola sp. G1-23]MCF2950048.1 TfoX/Sxy family protein [Paraglaciecola sp. G1-23]
MAYDQGLAQRLTEHFEGNADVESKKMFGGLCFMVCEHMCVGIVGDTLMARVGPDNYQACLNQPYAKEMDFTGKAMKGMVYVTPEGLDSDEELAHWVGICESFVRSLPPKVPKKIK